MPTARSPVMWRVALIMTMFALLGAACGDATTEDDADEALIVGAFDFPESEVLAELYAQALSAAGVPTRLVEQRGPREVLAPALEQGVVDLVPEYLGTATSFFAAAESSEASLAEELRSRGLRLLGNAAASNTNVFVVLADRELGPALSDLAADAPTLQMGGLPECADRPLCLVGLRDAYGIEFAEFVAYQSVEFIAEALRRDEVDVGLMFSTSAELTEDFRVLDDDRGLQPAENVVPIVTERALSRWDEATVVAAADAVSARLTTEDLRELNRRVAAGATAAEAARGWLAAESLVAE